jgi:DNA processing protein
VTGRDGAGTTHERLARIALGCLVEPGNRELGRLVRRYGAVWALELVLTSRLPSPGLIAAVATRLAASGHLAALEAGLTTEGSGGRLVGGDDGRPVEGDGGRSVGGDGGFAVGSEGRPSAGDDGGLVVASDGDRYGGHSVARDGGRSVGGDEESAIENDGVRFVGSDSGPTDNGQRFTPGDGEPAADGGPDAAFEARFITADGTRLSASASRYAVQAAFRLAEAALARADRLGARIVTPGDHEWPTQVEQLATINHDSADPVYRDADSPMCLWARGLPSVAEALDRSVAIVGARAASSYGQHVASELAYELANRDWTIVSGGAFGIDATAHRAAIAAGGLTVAVLACGIDRPYPASHASLFEQIADEGLVLSEWPPGAAPHRVRFLTRNRVIAAATRGTVMVEAGARSGARNTLNHARLLQRPVMVVPGPVTSAVSVGCHAELRKPGTLLVTRFDEVIEEIGQVGELATPQEGFRRPEDALDTIGRRLLDAVLPRKARTAEEIAAIAGLSGREARSQLPLLEADGFVVATESGAYRLASRHKPTDAASHRDQPTDA